MAAKKTRAKKPGSAKRRKSVKKRRKPGLLWRVLFGHNGPTKARLKKAWTQTFSNTFTIHERDPLTGRVRKHTMRVEADGRVVRAQPKPKRKPAAAKRATPKRGVSQPSKPSRASTSGTAQRRTSAPAAPDMRPGRAAPMSERVLQNPDGTFAGSVSADPNMRLRKAEAEYQKALRSANAAGRRADELLGWRTPKR